METVGEVAKKHVELFAVGTELVMGRIYDTNSFWIAEQLSKLGAWPRGLPVWPTTTTTWSRPSATRFSGGPG